MRHRYCGEHARIVDPREDTEPDAGSYLFFHAFIRGVPIDEIAIFISSAMRRRPARPVVNRPALFQIKLCEGLNQKLF